MARRLAPGLILVLALAGPALVGGDARAQSSDQRLQDLRAKIAAAEAQEARLSSEITSVEGKIRQLETQVGDVSGRLEILQRDLALHREKLARITTIFRFQTERL